MAEELKRLSKSPITWAWAGPVLLTIVLALSGYSFLSTVEAAKREIATVNQTLTSKMAENCKEIDDLQKDKLDKEQYYRDQDTIRVSLSELSKDVKVLIRWHVPQAAGK